MRTHTVTEHRVSSTECVCLPGHYLLLGECVLCKSNSFCSGNDNHKTDCTANSKTFADAATNTNIKNTDESSCLCNLGYTRNVAGQTSCLECESGKYKASYGTDACAVCAAGKYLEGTAATSVTSCVSCIAGKVLTGTGAKLATDCISCPAGKYSTVVAATADSDCLDCTAGKYSLVDGGQDETACLSCGAGSIQPALPPMMQACALSVRLEPTLRWRQQRISILV